MLNKLKYYFNINNIKKSLLGGQKMKKYLEKIIILTIVSSIILTLFIPAVVSNQDENDVNKLTCVKVFDTFSKNYKEYYFESDELKNLIKIIDDEITVDSFSQKMEDKLYLLKDYGMVSDKTVKTLVSQYKSYNSQIKSFKELIKPSSSTIFNIFSGTFFGIKGEKTNSFLELSVIQLPFFNGNITAGLIGFSKFIGKGSIFTVGFIGLKYIYDFNSTKYEFPYFPTITGNIVGFSGILIEINAQHTDIPEDMKGYYYIGVGMSIFTYWTNQ